MNTCPHCHIRVGGDTAYCPLCQNRLSGPAGEPYFPATAPRIHRASLLYKVVAFVLSALIVVAGAFDFLLMEDTPHRHFSILMAVWAVADEWTVLFDPVQQHGRVEAEDDAVGLSYQILKIRIFTGADVAMLQVIVQR